MEEEYHGAIFTDTVLSHIQIFSSAPFLKHLFQKYNELL
jgi:hypothetical protein